MIKIGTISRVSAIIGLLISSVLIAILVYMTGGTIKVYANLNYIPIAMAASFFGKKFGLLQAMVCGFLVGPFMPLNIETNTMQSAENWMMRLTIYLLIGGIIGALTDYKSKQEAILKKQLMFDSLSGFKTIEVVKNNSNINEDVVYCALQVRNYGSIFNYFGYEFSNSIIERYSKFLKDSFQHHCEVEIFRLKGLEYFFVCTSHDLSTDEMMLQLITSINQLNGISLDIMNVPIYFNVNFGISVPGKCTSSQGLRNAMIALEYATNNEMVFYHYEPKIEVSYNQSIEIASSFIEHLNHGNVFLYYQNIYDNNGNEVYAIELLTRWKKNDTELISPDIFIPVLEKTELIDALLRHNIDIAIQHLKTSSSRYLVSINWSTKNLTLTNFEYLMQNVIYHDVLSSRIQVELTESGLLTEDNHVIIKKLKQNGFVISVDDFGIGFSAYHYLGVLPIDVVKIDNSLIKKVLENKIISDLCQSLISFCHLNQIMVVAEGIETVEVFQACKALGVDYFQGFYFHVPEKLELSSVEKIGGEE